MPAAYIPKKYAILNGDIDLTISVFSINFTKGNNMNSCLLSLENKSSERGVGGHSLGNKFAPSRANSFL